MEPRLSIFTTFFIFFFATASLGLIGQEEEKKEKWNPDFTAGKEQEIAKEILALPDGNLKHAALSGLARIWIEDDWDAAWTFGSTLEKRELKLTFLRTVAPYLAENQPGLILDQRKAGTWWPDQWKHLRDALLKMADHDLDRAVEVYVDHTPDRMQIGEVARQLALRIVLRDSQDAGFAFAEKLKDKAKPYAGAIQGTLQGWVKIDEAAAIAYAEDLDDEGLMPWVVSGLLTGTNWFTHPQEGLEWVTQLAHDGLRRHALANLVYLWHDKKNQREIDRILKSDLVEISDRQFLIEAMERMQIPVPGE
jgi:hypothetical protein